VGSNGTIDWYCCPSFDSPAVFGSLLESDRGGYFVLAAAVPAETRQFYLPDTARAQASGTGAVTNRARRRGVPRER
jgi:GH15 family glucan-1,4-alpha-glucosidase